MSDATISSFVLRFVQEHDADEMSAKRPWRGIVRHIQSNEELRFTHIDEALQFIQQYVSIDELDDVDGVE